MTTLSEQEAQDIILRHDAVIFDNDGTLVDSMPVHRIAWVTALTQHGISFTEAQFYQMAGMTAPAIIERLCAEQGIEPAVSVESVQSARKAALADELRRVKAVEVVKRLFEFAKSHGKPVAVASGSEAADVRETLDGAGYDWRIDFNAFVTTEDVTHGKPHPETFLTAAARLGVDPGACVGLEDGDKGLQALDAASMTKIDVRRLEGYPLPGCLKPKMDS